MADPKKTTFRGAAEAVRRAGRYDDTVLVHVTPREFQILKAINPKGGDINPRTGIPEFFGAGGYDTDTGQESAQGQSMGGDDSWGGGGGGSDAGGFGGGSKGGWGGFEGQFDGWTDDQIAAAYGDKPGPGDSFQDVATGAPASPGSKSDYAGAPAEGGVKDSDGGTKAGGKPQPGEKFTDLEGRPVEGGRKDDADAPPAQGGPKADEGGGRGGEDLDWSWPPPSPPPAKKDEEEAAPGDPAPPAPPARGATDELQDDVGMRRRRGWMQRGRGSLMPSGSSLGARG